MFIIVFIISLQHRRIQSISAFQYSQDFDFYH